MSNNNILQFYKNDIEIPLIQPIKQDHGIGGCLNFYLDRTHCKFCKFVCVHSLWTDLQPVKLTKSNNEVNFENESFIPRFSRTEGYRTFLKVHELFPHVTSQLETLQRNCIRNDANFRAIQDKILLNNFAKDQELLSKVGNDYFEYIREFSSYFKLAGILSPEVLVERNSKSYYAKALWNWIFKYYEFFKQSIPSVLMLPVDFNTNRFEFNFKKVNEYEPQVIGFYKGRYRIEERLMKQIKLVKSINPDIKVLLGGISSPDLITRFFKAGVDIFVIRSWERQKKGEKPKFNPEDFPEQWGIANQLEESELNIKRIFELLSYKEKIERLKSEFNGQYRIKK